MTEGDIRHVPSTVCKEEELERNRCRRQDWDLPTRPCLMVLSLKQHLSLSPPPCPLPVSREHVGADLVQHL